MLFTPFLRRSFFDFWGMSGFEPMHSMQACRRSKKARSLTYRLYHWSQIWFSTKPNCPDMPLRWKNCLSSACSEYERLYQKIETNIPRNETARPRSQFLHSCICERLKYSHDRSTHGRMNYKTPNPIRRLFFKIDQLTDFAALCLTDFIDWRYIHSVVCIFDPGCKLLPPWMKKQYLCTVYTDSVCGWGGRGGVLNCAVNHSFTLCFWPDSEPTILLHHPKQMTSKEDIRGLVSLSSFVHGSTYFVCGTIVGIHKSLTDTGM